MSSRPDLTAGVRLRVPLVFVIPIVSLLVIGVTAVGVSQVLLNIPKEAATIVALALALNILGACAVVALRRQTDASTMGELMVVVSYPLVIGIVLAIVGFGSGGHGGEDHGGEPAPAGGARQIVAQNVQFNTDSIDFPAEEEVEFVLDNQDSVEHNFSIYENENAQQDLFIGQNVGPGAATTYDIPAMPAGEYFFRCDLHPTSMVGTVHVE